MSGGRAHAPASARRITLSATGLVLSTTLPQYMVGAVAVSIRQDFGFSSAELGLAVGASFGVAAVTTAAAGRVIDGIGPLAGIRISIVLLLASVLAIATVVGSAASLIICMAGVGLAAGIGSPSFAALLAGGVPYGRQGTAFGLLTSAPQLSAFMAGLALPLIADPFGWRVAFVIPVVTVGASLLAMPSLRQLPTPSAVPTRRVISIRRPQPIHLMALAGTLASAGGIGMRSFLVVFAVAVGFSSSDAGLLLAAAGLIALVSRIAIGVLGDRRPGDALLRAGGLMLVSATGFVLMAIGAHFTIIIGALLAGGLGWGWVAPMNLAVIQRHRDAPAAAMGTQMTGFFSGALIGPLLVGILIGTGGFTEAWVLCTVFAVLAAVAAFGARRMRVEPA